MEPESQVISLSQIQFPEFKNQFESDKVWVLYHEPNWILVNTFLGEVQKRLYYNPLQLVKEIVQHKNDLIETINLDYPKTLPSHVYNGCQYKFKQFTGDDKIVLSDDTCIVKLSCIMSVTESESVTDKKIITGREYVYNGVEHIQKEDVPYDFSMYIRRYNYERWY